MGSGRNSGSGHCWIIACSVKSITLGKTQQEWETARRRDAETQRHREAHKRLIHIVRVRHFGPMIYRLGKSRKLWPTQRLSWTRLGGAGFQQASNPRTWFMSKYDCVFVSFCFSLSFCFLRSYRSNSLASDTFDTERSVEWCNCHVGARQPR